MSTASEGILEAALQLSEPECAHVIQELLDSLSPDAETLVDDAWAAELDRRLAEFQEGDVGAVPWRELRKEK